MQRRFAAGELEDFDSAFAVNHALDAALQIVQRHGVHLLRRRRPGESAKQVGQARLQELTISMSARQVESFSMTPRASPGLALRPSVPAASRRRRNRPGPPQQRVFRFALREPIKARVGGDADTGLAVFGTGALEKNFGGNSAGAPDLGRTGCVADRTAGCRAFQEFVGKFEIHRRF